MSHAEDFRVESQNDRVARQLIYDYRKADLPAADRALCDYAVKLTLRPGAVRLGDVQRLGGFGFGDRDISDAVQVIGYFNYINRVADGLGVEPEVWMRPPEDEWRREKAASYGSA